jgi:uncharacterized Zn finger protein
MRIWNHFTSRYEETFDPCPLCGESENIDTKGETLVECRECGLTLYGENMIELIKKWNTRVNHERTN